MYLNEENNERKQREWMNKESKKNQKGMKQELNENENKNGGTRLVTKNLLNQQPKDTISSRYTTSLISHIIQLDYCRKVPFQFVTYPPYLTYWTE